MGGFSGRATDFLDLIEPRLSMLERASPLNDALIEGLVELVLSKTGLSDWLVL